MSDRDRTAGPDEPADVPVLELAAFGLDPDPELPGRVQRSIQRRMFAADSLEFSVTAMVATFWDYLCALMEALGERNPERKD